MSGTSIIAQIFIPFVARFVQFQSQQKSTAFVNCRNVLEAFSTKREDPDQTAPDLGLHCLL